MTKKPESGAEIGTAKNENKIKNKFAKCSEEFLRLLPFVEPTTASLIFMCVASLDQREATTNSTKVIIELDDFLDAIPRPKSAEIVGSSNYTHWFKGIWNKALLVSVDGEVILENYTVDYESDLVDGELYTREVIKVQFNVRALRRFFENFKGQWYQVWVNDVYRLRKHHSWNTLRNLIYYQTSSHIIRKEYWTSDIKWYLGLDENAFVKKDGHFLRTNFEQQCIRAPLAELAGGEYIKVRMHNNRGKEDYFHKDFRKGEDGKWHIKYFISYEIHRNLISYVNNKQDDTEEETL